MTKPLSKQRPKPYEPPDAAEIDTFLDFMAGLMTRNPEAAPHLLPVWRALVREHKKAVENEAALAAVRERAKRITQPI